jgi:hypothetical protein
MSIAQFSQTSQVFSTPYGQKAKSHALVATNMNLLYSKAYEPITGPQCINKLLIELAERK